MVARISTHKFEQNASRVPRDGAKIRVLCVDDNYDLADSYQMMLDLSGFNATSCYDGAHALEIAKSFVPDVCIIDLNMPRMAGDEVARRLLAMFPDDPPFLIAITAMSGELYRVLTKVAGFQVHLVKPVDPNELIDVIESSVAWHARCQVIQPALVPSASQ